uniref:Fe2OG dioxygenase domain-containing protein n=1 Tax=Chrysotila carterae TaxID=13221 RepID=A0A7S4BK02_CHRCT
MRRYTLFLVLCASWNRQHSLRTIVAVRAADEADTVAALIAQARILARESRVDEAETALTAAQRAAESDRTSSPSKVAEQVAEVVLLQGNLAMYLRSDAVRAERLYRESLRQHARWDGYWFLGKALRQQGQPTAAAAAFEAAAALNTANTASRLEAAGSWVEAGSFGDAKRVLRAAAKAEPHGSEAPLALARTATQLGAPAHELLQIWRDAVELRPWQASVLIEGAASGVFGADEAHEHATSPQSSPLLRRCDLVAAARVLAPGTPLPPQLEQACAAALGSAGQQTADRAPLASAVEALRGGACALLVGAPELAPYAAVSEADQSECVVSLAPSARVRLGSAAHGLIIHRGEKLTIMTNYAGSDSKAGNGSDDSEAAVLDAGGTSRHFLVAGGDLTLENVSLRGGRSLLSGGGAVMIVAGALRVRGGSFESNRAVLGSGGAVAARCAIGCELSFESVTFRANSATWRGGAISTFGGVLEETRKERATMGHPTTVEFSKVEFVDNSAARGAPEIHACGVDVSGVSEDLVARLCKDEGVSSGGGDGGGADDDGDRFSPLMLEALEAQADALELLEVEGLGRHALAAMQRASVADGTSPTAFATHFTFLYTRAMDSHAAARLAAYQLARPADPSLSAYHATLQNKSAPALLQRGRTLNAEVEMMRTSSNGVGATSLLFTSRDEAQDAATSAFVKSLVLDPTNGDAWHDLGTSLFFAGEMAEAELVYARGLQHAPSHEGLLAEAKKARAYPPAPDESDATVAQFTDADFRSIAIPPGCFGDRPNARDIQSGAEVFGASPTVYVTRDPMLTADEAQTAIKLANQWADRHGGWTTSRHYSVATTDVPLTSLPEALPWFNAALAKKLLPALASRYPAAAPKPSKLRVLDCFLVRYRAGEQPSLPTHSDQSLLSFTIALNDPREYEGGGTSFPTLGLALDAPNAGHAVLFPGKLLHGGAEITRGTRYVIVLFMGYFANRSGRKPGYVLREMQNLRDLPGDDGRPTAGGAGKDEL